ncbi:MAG: Ig-like domain-containing protein [Sandaracinaceae bacterium]|nr:Ig-like domain-containing protein [Sandaracinaceae bacterium]
MSWPTVPTLAQGRVPVILRITCDDAVQSLYVDGVAQGTRPNWGDWRFYDDYSLDLDVGDHTIAFQGTDRYGVVAGCLLALYEQGTMRLIAVTSGGAGIRTTSTMPPSNWYEPGFNDSGWEVAAGCPNNWWGTAVNWGYSVGGQMVWSPRGCTDFASSPRWFRWRVRVTCGSDTHCNDTNECTRDECVSNACRYTPLPVGSSCSGGVCNASATCVRCIDTNPTSTDPGCTSDRPHCQTSGPSAPICQPCIDSSPTGQDLGCSASSPFCITTSSGVNQCVQCTANTHCNDTNECTTDECRENLCHSTPLALGTPCSLGICDINHSCSALSVDIESPSKGSTLSQSRPTISGTATPGTEVEIQIDGMVVGTARAGADGRWVFTPTEPLAEGAHNVTATVRANGMSASDATNFSIDLSTYVSIQSPSDGAVLSNNRPSISGRGEPGATVTVSINGMVVGSTTVGNDGTWSIGLSEELRDGEYQVEARATDSFGHTAQSRSNFRVDTTTFVEITSIEGSTVRGRGEPGAQVVVTIGGMSYGPVTVRDDGSWEIDLGMHLGPGMHTVEARAEDQAGNRATDSEMVQIEAPPADAGPFSDGGLLDGGVVDAPTANDGSVDSGMLGSQDASAPEGGPFTQDAGGVPSPGGVAGGACGCRMGSRSMPSLVLCLATLLALLIRVRRRG